MPGQLSQGQAQRVAIARALINKPSLIIGDEPTGNLDSIDSRVVMELFSNVHRQGNTILLVTHNPELTRYANRVIYMHDGMIIGDEKTAIGDVARGAKQTHYKKQKLSDEDIVAGVSALMHKVPTKELQDKPKAIRRTRKNGGQESNQKGQKLVLWEVISNQRLLVCVLQSGAQSLP